MPQDYYDSLLGDQALSSQILRQDTSERMNSLLAPASTVTNVPNTAPPIIDKGYSQPDILQGNTEDIVAMQFSPDPEKAAWAQNAVHQKNLKSDNSILYMNGVGGDKTIPYDKSMDKYLNSKYGYDPTSSLEENEQWNYDNVKMAHGNFARYGSDVATFLGRTLESTGVKLAGTLGLMGSMVANIGSNDYWGHVADNSFSRWVDGIDEDQKNGWLKVWKDAGSKDNGFFQSMGTEEFWNDKVADGIGFMASAMILNAATGALASGALGMVGAADFGATAIDTGALLSRGASTLKGIQRAVSVGRMLDTGIAALTGAKDIGGVGAWALDLSMQAAWGASGTYKETYNDLINSGMVADKAASLASKRASSDFTGNLFALSLATAVENKMIFQPARKVFSEMGMNASLNKDVNTIYGDGIEGAQSLLSKAKLSAYSSDPDIGLQLAKDLEYSTKVGKYLDLKNPYSRARMLPASIGKIGAVDALFKMNMQLAIDRMSRYGEYDNNGWVDNVTGTLSQLMAQTGNAFNSSKGIRYADVMSKNNLTEKDDNGNPIGVDKESQESITSGAIVGILGEQAIEHFMNFAAKRGWAPPTEKMQVAAHIDAIRDAYNISAKNFLSVTDIYRSTIDDKGKAVYDIGDDGNLVIDKDKVAKVSNALSSHFDKQELSENLSDPTARDYYQKSLLADLYHAAVYAGVEQKLIGNLKDISGSSKEDIIQLGFNPTDIMSTPSELVTQLSEFAKIHDEAFLSKVARPSSVKPEQYSAIDPDRKYAVYKSRVEASLLKDSIAKNDAKVTDIQTHYGSDPEVDQYNSLVLQKNALKQFGDISAEHSTFYNGLVTPSISKLSTQITELEKTFTQQLPSEKNKYVKDESTGLYKEVDSRGNGVIPDSTYNAIVGLLKSKMEATNSVDQKVYVADSLSDIKDGYSNYREYYTHNIISNSVENPIEEPITVEETTPAAKMEERTDVDKDGVHTKVYDVKDTDGNTVSTTDSEITAKQEVEKILAEKEDVDKKSSLDDIFIPDKAVNENDELNIVEDNTPKDEAIDKGEDVVKPVIVTLANTDATVVYENTDSDQKEDVIDNTGKDTSEINSPTLQEELGSKGITVVVETEGDLDKSVLDNGQFTSDSQYKGALLPIDTPLITSKYQVKDIDDNTVQLKNDEYDIFRHRFIMNTNFDGEFLAKHEFLIVNDFIHEGLAPHKGAMYGLPYNTTNEEKGVSVDFLSKRDAHVIVIRNTDTGKLVTIGEHMYTEGINGGFGTKININNYYKGRGKNYQGIHELPLVFSIDDKLFSKGIDARIEKNSEKYKVSPVDVRNKFVSDLDKMNTIREYLNKTKGLTLQNGTNAGLVAKVPISFSDAYRGIFIPLRGEGQVVDSKEKTTLKPISEVFKDRDFVISVAENDIGRFRKGSTLLTIKNGKGAVDSKVAVFPRRINDKELDSITKIIDTIYSSKKEAYDIVENRLKGSFFTDDKKFFVVNEQVAGKEYKIEYMAIPDSARSMTKEDALLYAEKKDLSSLYWNTNYKALSGKVPYTTLEGQTLTPEEYVGFIKDRLQTNLKLITDIDNNVRMNEPVNSSFSFKVSDDVVQGLKDYISPKKETVVVRDEEPNDQAIEYKRADIERRRQEELSNYSLRILEDGGNEFPESQEEEQEWKEFGNPHDNAKLKINAQYDAELAALEHPTREKSEPKQDIKQEEKPSDIVEKAVDTVESKIDEMLRKYNSGEEMTKEEKALYKKYNSKIVDPTVGAQDVDVPAAKAGIYNITHNGQEYSIDTTTGVISDSNNNNIKGNDYIDMLDRFATNIGFDKTRDVRGIAKEDFTIVDTSLGGFNEDKQQWEGDYMHIRAFGLPTKEVFASLIVDDDNNVSLKETNISVDNDGNILVGGKIDKNYIFDNSNKQSYTDFQKRNC